MNIDTLSEFGKYEPSETFKFFIRMGQSIPNFLGQQFAQVVRKYLINKRGPIPLDVVVEGLNFRLYLIDNASEYKFAFMPWRFDQKERNFMKQRLKADSIFIDIGANVGIYTLSAAKYLRNDGRIISFEPNPVTYERLKYNVSCQTNELLCRNIEIMNIGLSSKQESIDLYIDENNLGSCSTLPTVSKKQSVISIKCYPLLYILEEKNIPKIDLLKIDIEGAEDTVIVPFFKQAPKRLYPENIIIENSQKVWRIDLFELLISYGYRVAFKTKMNTVLSL
jgi:FkbM family methyltransferase